jgi:hypothetical protein
MSAISIIPALSACTSSPVPGTSTDPANRTLATFVRFDNVQPLSGQIVLGWDTVTAGFDRGAPVNAVQLLLNAPDPGPPPQITQNPQPQVTIEGATVIPYSVRLPHSFAARALRVRIS